MNIPLSAQKTWQSAVPSNSSRYSGLQIQKSNTNDQKMMVAYAERKKAVVNVNFSLAGPDDFQVCNLLHVIDLTVCVHQFSANEPCNCSIVDKQ